MTEPTFTRTDECGHVVVEWPVPPSPAYLVAHELLDEWAALLNRLADLRCRLDESLTIECEEVRRLMDGPTGGRVIF